MTRHWSINGRFLTQSLSGVQRYAHEIVRELDGMMCAGHGAFGRGLSLDILVPPGTVPPWTRALPVRVAGIGGGHLWEQAVLPFYVRGGLLSLCNTGPVLLSRQIVCLHDVNTRIVPDSYSFAFRALYRVLHPVLGRTAQRIATVSGYSAGEIVRLGIAPPRKIAVRPDGHEHALAWVPRHSERTKALADGRTITVIGSPAPHKNVGLLLGLAERLARDGLRVAVAGVRDPKVFGSRSGSETDMAPAAGVAWLGFLSDGEIAALLRDSLCLAFPSYAEGFGIPAVEAMVWGCPVVASDRASLPEICGEAALYADPGDPEAWLAQFRRLAGDAALRASLAAKGRTQAARFSWRRTAEAYLSDMAGLSGLTGC